MANNRLLVRELILTVTNRCDHGCAMCYYHRAINKKIKELSREEYEKISLALPKIDLIMISGGEPFLRKDLAAICKIFYENNNTRSFFIPTNGSCTPDILKTIGRVLETMPKARLSLMFSLEGTRVTHDRIHGRRGAFDSVCKTIEALNTLRLKMLQKEKCLRFGITLNTVATNRNIKEILPLMEYVKSNLWVDSHTFSPMRGKGRNPGYKPPSAELFNNLFRKAGPYFKYYSSRKHFSDIREKDTMTWLRNRYKLWIDLLKGEPLPVACQAGSRIGVIEPEGSVRLCELTPSIGSLRESNYDFEKVWFSRKADLYREKIRSCSCTHACFINASQR